MEELTGSTLAEGWWCTTCEMFEDEDHSEPITAEVVAK